MEWLLDGASIQGEGEGDLGRGGRWVESEEGKEGRFQLLDSSSSTPLEEKLRPFPEEWERKVEASLERSREVDAIVWGVD